ncbi:MAG: MBOAT family protein [Bacteroidales bacterium]|nr:MBOAT family protein [Bacteroidales bacterium]
MLFNSIEFVIFLPVVFFIYWFVLNKKSSYQNIFLLIASYVFYGWWDWRFLSLIIISSFVDFFVAQKIQKAHKVRNKKILLTISILINIGFLGFFKYFNFFVDSFVEAFAQIGIHLNPRTLNIILPVGISFYTFQTLSYTIDVYRGKLKPTKDIVSFFTFVAFFPQLVAGPIERAVNLLPQFYHKRAFEVNKAKDGMKQILWGLFKKIIIADNCAVYVEEIFSNYQIYPGSTLLLGSFFFAFQIYCDFSGYSDIAIGTARLFGFNIMRNFAYPYFSRDIAEFWRRWHISLSTWFRDYVYIPLGGSRGNNFNKIRNVIIIFVVSGFWHGADWTFIIWGLLNGLYFLPLLLLKINRNNIGITAENRLLPTFKETFQMLITFFITLIAWVFFRSDNVGQAFSYISIIFSESLFTIPNLKQLIFVPIIILFIIIEWFSRKKQHALEISNLPKTIRWSVYLIIGFIVLLSFNNNPNTFIYFQF